MAMSSRHRSRLSTPRRTKSASAAASTLALNASLGSFPGRVGHHYTLTLRVNDGTSQLDSVSPILKVRIPRADWEGYGVGVAFEKLEAGALGFVGLIVIGIAFQMRRRAQKTTGWGT